MPSLALAISSDDQRLPYHAVARQDKIAGQAAKTSDDFHRWIYVVPDSFVLPSRYESTHQRRAFSVRLGVRLCGACLVCLALSVRMNCTFLVAGSACLELSISMTRGGRVWAAVGWVALPGSDLDDVQLRHGHCGCHFCAAYREVRWGLLKPGVRASGLSARHVWIG